MAEPTCLRVVGNTAYVDAIVTKATDPTGLICTDTPPANLPADAITHGNFVVR